MSNLEIWTENHECRSKIERETRGKKSFAALIEKFGIHFISANNKTKNVVARRISSVRSEKLGSNLNEHCWGIWERGISEVSCFFLFKFIATIDISDIMHLTPIKRNPKDEAGTHSQNKFIQEIFALTII